MTDSRVAEWRNLSKAKLWGSRDRAKVYRCAKTQEALRDACDLIEFLESRLAKAEAVCGAVHNEECETCRLGQALKELES